MNKIFLDTNIVIDIIQDRVRKARILELLDLEVDFNLYISAKSFADIFYILKKKVSKQFIQDKLEDLIILDSTGKSCEFAIANTDKHDDVEDIMQIACSNENKIDTFITADPKLIEYYGQLFNIKTKIIIL